MTVNRILIVDDDEALQFYLSTILQENFPTIKVLQAYDGQEASELLKNIDETPDIIFLDINMPIMNGIKFLEEKQAFLSAYNIRVVIITSSDNEKDKEATKKFIFIEDYVVKPVLESALKKYLEK